MKKTFFTLIAGIFYTAVSGQITEGKVIYERTYQLQFQVRSMNPELEKQLPRTHISTFELLFTAGRSLWQSLPDVNQEANRMSGTEGGPGVRTMITSFMGDEMIYDDLEKNKRLSQRELSSRRYLIEDTVPVLNWKLTGESKMIIGYKAFQAVAQTINKRSRMSMENGEFKSVEVTDTSNVIAWFTPEIPTQAGPVYSGQLPGLLLELDINNGQTLYRAIEFSPKVSLSAIREPKGGKRVTGEQFRKEMQEMIQERTRQISENGGRITIQSGQ